EGARSWLYAAYYGGNIGIALALLAVTRRPDVLPGSFALAPLLIGDLVLLAASGLFLYDVAAPPLLRRPDPHCPYDLIPQAPAAVIAVVLFLGGSFCLGWAGVARWCGRRADTEPFLAGAVRNLLLLSLWGYAASLLLLSLELVLAN